MESGLQDVHLCEGGHGHAFRHPTIGLDVVGDYFKFRDRLAGFLFSKGCEGFEISLVTCYDHEHPKGCNIVYLEGMHLLSPEKRKKALASIKRKDARLLRRLNSLAESGLPRRAATR